MNMKLNTKVYPLEIILNTCYSFIDRIYFFLDADSKGNNIKISFKEKKKLSQAQLKSLRGEFMNELLYNALRSQTATNNKKIREYIIGRALYATPILSPNLGLEPEEALDYKNDPLGIAVPWEEKYGKKLAR